MNDRTSPLYVATLTVIAVSYLNENPGASRYELEAHLTMACRDQDTKEATGAVVDAVELQRRHGNAAIGEMANGPDPLDLEDEAEETEAE